LSSPPRLCFRTFGASGKSSYSDFIWCEVDGFFFQGHAPVVAKFFPGDSFSARSTIAVQFFSDCGSFPGSSPTPSVSKSTGSVERVDGDGFRIHLVRPIGDTGASTRLICLPLFPLVMNRLGGDKMIGSTGEASVRSSTSVPLLARSPIQILVSTLIAIILVWASRCEPQALLVPLRSLPVLQEVVWWTWEFPMDHDRTLTGHVNNRFAVFSLPSPTTGCGLKASRVTSHRFIACVARGSHDSRRRLANPATQSQCSLSALDAPNAEPVRGIDTIPSNYGGRRRQFNRILHHPSSVPRAPPILRGKQLKPKRHSNFGL